MASFPSARAVLRASAVVTLLYFVAAIGSIVLSRQPGGVATLWYANAVALCFLLMQPGRIWPALMLAVAAGDLAANMLLGNSLRSALAFLPGNLVEILLGAYLLRRFCRLREASTDAAMLLKVLFYGAVLPVVAGALVGAEIVSRVRGGDFLHLWLGWFQGSAVGGLAVLPLGILYSTRTAGVLLDSARRPAVLLSLGCAAVAALWVPTVLPLPYIYLASALLLVAATGRFAATSIAVMLCSISLRAPMLGGAALLPSEMVDPAQQILLFLPCLLVLVPPILMAAALEGVHQQVRRLAAQEHHFREMYQKSPAMMHAVDPQRRVIDVSAAWLERLGYRREEVLGRDSMEFLTPDSRKLAEEVVVPQLFNTGYLRDIEYQLLTKQGEVVDVLLSAVLELDEDMRPWRALAVLKDVTETRSLVKKMVHLAHHDALTGLPNRALFQDRVLQACQFARRHHSRFAVMFMDLDHFKRVNDSLGHAVGDELLKTIARRLTETLRSSDTVSRLGGDEFVLLVPDVDGPVPAGEVARKLLADVAQPQMLEGTEVSVSFSLGIALYPEDGTDPDTLMRRADAAMYRSKQGGRNRFDFFSKTMEELAMDRLQLETDMRRGLADGEFLVHYQPIVESARRRPVAVEALARWMRQGHELVAPEKFIPIAEENGLIVPLGADILWQACEQLRVWSTTPLRDVRITVNVSAVQLASPGFVTTVTQALRASGVEGHKLEIEITESTLIKNPQHTLEVLKQLKLLGITIALDDFGTGYSSLSMLKNFPVDTVKIDRSFINDLETDPNDRELVNGIVAMSRSLRLSVTAEGVETDRQAVILATMQCPALQGYLFSHPIGPDGITAWLSARIA